LHKGLCDAEERASLKEVLHDMEPHEKMQSADENPSQIPRVWFGSQSAVDSNSGSDRDSDFEDDDSNSDSAN
jgi:hypothetical protein